MRASPRLRIFAAVFVVCAGLIAGCASGTNPSAPGAKAIEGGKITYGVAGGGLTSLDPHKVSSAALLPVMSLLYNGLTQYGKDNSVQPGLALSWSSNADATTWTFRLRPNVTFHNGKPFTAQDAVDNITRVLDPTTGSQQRSTLSSIAKATAVDPLTLELSLSKPNAILPSALTGLYITDVSTIGQVNTLANGTGPYKLSQFVPDDHVKVVRNPTYWGTRGHLDEIDITVTPDNTSAVNSLRNRDLDVVWNVPPPTITQLKNDPSLTLVDQSGYTGTVIWELDTTSAPFNDARARQALSYMVNRAQALTLGYNGLGAPADTNSPMNPKQAEYAKDLPSYPQDLQKAQQLFQAAGVAAGTKFDFWTTAGRNPQWVTMAEILQQDLKKIGYDLMIDQQQNTVWLQKFYPAGKKFPNTIVANYISSPAEPSQQFNFLRGGVCECNWNNAEYDQLLQQAIATSDAAARTAIYQKMQSLVNQEIPVVIPLTTSQFTVANSRVVGAWVQSNGVTHLEDAGVTGP